MGIRRGFRRLRLNGLCNAQQLCQFPGALQNFAMEEFGSNSICLDHDRQDPWRIQTEIGFSDLKMLGASCHRHRCVRGSGLEVTIGNSTYTCPLEGGSIKLNVEAPSGRLLGSVHCPICETLCPMELYGWKNADHFGTLADLELALVE
ncbi:hypothetical protein X801_04327 [Opisthorchis viverrini]|uniref:Leishmanolysin-like peptidase n=1 Tax=Opisthorchis viverrini TaxID=6198 RepID=A0A1S8WZW9_OPIVI|nr:hypothetical protein X801_04327 [Opisthorchis viverrini]